MLVFRQASTAREKSTEIRPCGWLSQEREPTGTQERSREKKENMGRVKCYKGRHAIFHCPWADMLFSIAHETRVLRGKVALGSLNGTTSHEGKMNYSISQYISHVPEFNKG